MRILAIDTATERCSVAVQTPSTLHVRESLAPRHGAFVLGMVHEVLAEATLSLGELDGLAFGRGPGAFTGVRIAVGVVQGLALGSGLPSAGVSNLAAVAEAYRGGCVEGERVLVCMDARMGEVYWCLYEANGERLVPLVAEQVASPDVAMAVDDTRLVVVCGTGLAAHAELRHRYARFRQEPGALPHAREIARIGAGILAAGGGVPAAAVTPVYLRDKVAWAKA